MRSRRRRRLVVGPCTPISSTIAAAAAGSGRIGDESMRLLARCLSALLLFLGSTGYAADYSATGTVNILRTRGFLPGVESDSLSLAGVDSLWTCKPDEAGHVVLLLPHGKGGE